MNRDEPVENLNLTQSHWLLSHMPGRNSDPGGGERQLAVSSNALDRTTIRAGPIWRFRIWVMATFSAMYMFNRDEPFVSAGGNGVPDENSRLTTSH